MKDDPMTDTTYTLGPQDGLARLIWLWLTTPRPRTAAVDLATMSDHIRRDIGSPRGSIGAMAMRAPHDINRNRGKGGTQ
jgi:hypothetical protein